MKNLSKKIISASMLFISPLLIFSCAGGKNSEEHESGPIPIPEPAENYAGGSGTQADPWLIANDAQLMKFSKDYVWDSDDGEYNYYENLDHYYKLTSNLVLDNWAPAIINDYENEPNSDFPYFCYFTNCGFDGNGHTITLNWNKKRSESLGFKRSPDGLNLFGEIINCESYIKNLTLILNVDNCDNEVGGLLGYISGDDTNADALIENVMVKGSVKSAANMSAFCYAGYADGGSVEFKNCTVDVDFYWIPSPTYSVNYTFIAPFIGQTQSDVAGHLKFTDCTCTSNCKINVPDINEPTGSGTKLTDVYFGKLYSFQGGHTAKPTCSGCTINTVVNINSELTKHETIIE